MTFPDGLGPDRWEDMPKKTYVPTERLKAMEEDGVDVHTFFSNIAGVAGQTFSNPIYEDVDFRMECIRAYNDWQIEEWADPYPGRFITIALVPLWDAELAAAEVQPDEETRRQGDLVLLPPAVQLSPHLRPILGPVLAGGAGRRPFGQSPHRLRAAASASSTKAGLDGAAWCRSPTAAPRGWPRTSR